MPTGVRVWPADRLLDYSVQIGRYGCDYVNQHSGGVG